MEKECLLKTKKCTMVAFNIIKCKGTEFFNYKTASDTKDNGFRTKRMELEYTLGLMEVSIKGSMWKENDQEREKWYTKMVKSIKVSGKTEQKAGKEHIVLSKTSSMLNGKTDK
jgi:hypothetical protein